MNYRKSKEKLHVDQFWEFKNRAPHISKTKSFRYLVTLTRAQICNQKNCLPRMITCHHCLIYSQTFIKWHCIKQSPCIKWSVLKVLNFFPFIMVNFTSIKGSPLLNSHGHPLNTESQQPVYLVLHPHSTVTQSGTTK